MNPHDMVPPDPLLLNAFMATAQSLLQHVHTDTFYNHLTDTVNRLVPVDSLVVLGLAQGEKPTVIHDALHPREKSSFYEIYMAGAYLLSPLYQHWQDLPNGFFRIDDMGLDELEDSDFSRAYYKDCGLCDEANFVVHTSPQHAVALCFGRQQLPMPFSPLELHYLHLIEPIFRAALQRQHEYMIASHSTQPDATQTASKTAPAQANLPAHNVLMARLHEFGSTLLTDREQEVLAQILKGKASKLAAKALRISPETERSHRKKIYTKFGVTSQTELFSLVLNHVVYLDGGTAEAD
ncbi:helix-turn-helix transcriptional regulator [Aestuariicella hydrocarbonica]|uniref:Helix-turn-helix transcriptional regulator n=1 Tax=Pseudomaricurvus hydrocarbonicus TaxID=1470433 RepID=A0A9E5MLZ1_9GAMM|nr:helix-turn-helix transcriptional regulator [Aestuariicella hydrocarbonica]NHO65843.1 helix-turn-helix transcriptional regulator [Aestuariicella hydrocarbonica]